MFNALLAFVGLILWQVSKDADMALPSSVWGWVAIYGGAMLFGELFARPVLAAKGMKQPPIRGLTTVCLGFLGVLFIFWATGHPLHIPGSYRNWGTGGSSYSDGDHSFGDWIGPGGR